MTTPDGRETLQDKLKVTINADDRKRPLLHVLASDGRMTEFASTKVVIPEAPEDERATQVYGLLINGNGEPFVDADGQYVVMEAPPMQLGRVTPAEPMNGDLLSFADLAERAGVNISTVKRAVQRGELPRPQKKGARAVRFPFDDELKQWIEQNRR